MNSLNGSLATLVLALVMSAAGCQTTPAAAPSGEGALPFATLRLTFDT